MVHQLPVSGKKKENLSNTHTKFETTCLKNMNTFPEVYSYIFLQYNVWE